MASKSCSRKAKIGKDFRVSSIVLAEQEIKFNHEAISRI